VDFFFFLFSSPPPLPSLPPTFTVPLILSEIIVDGVLAVAEEALAVAVTLFFPPFFFPPISLSYKEEKK